MVRAICECGGLRAPSRTMGDANNGTGDATMPANNHDFVAVTVPALAPARLNLPRRGFVRRVEVFAARVFGLKKSQVRRPGPTHA